MGTVSQTCRQKCDAGFYLSTDNSCKPLPPCTTGNCTIQDADPDAGLTCPYTGNPISTASGNKFQSEPDFIGGNGLSVSRYFNGTSRTDLGLGAGWRHNWMRRIVLVAQSSYLAAPANDVDPDWNALAPAVTSPAYYLVEREDGKSFAFNLNGQPKTVSKLNPYQLTITSTGFTVNDGINTESYDQTGKLSQVAFPNAYLLTLSYNSDALLTQVADNLGHQLNLDYHDAFHLSSIQANGVTVASYAYSAGRLSSVTYADNTSRQYLYEDTRNPYLLTGLIDESGNRFATWSYNDQGQAISSSHAGGIDQYTLNFGGDQTVGPRWTDETDPLGSVRRFTFSKVAGSWLLNGKNQPGGAGCSAATSGMTYDANGNVASRIDFNGNTTTYLYDLTRNLETSRTEASGTPQARTISTEWHPTWRLISKVTEPGRITAYDWDSVTANLNSKTITADGNTQVWRWTYLDKGLMATSTDPAGQVTQYTYDAHGNLATVTNPLAQVTQITQYDANGRPLTIIDANHITSTLTYSPRGWLTSRTVGGETTTYAYDAVGQLINLTLPTGRAVNYSYDAAHRLSDVSDSNGNTIHYTLDAMGHPLREEVSDPNGDLMPLSQPQVPVVNLQPKP